MTPQKADSSNLNNLTRTFNPYYTVHVRGSERSILTAAGRINTQIGADVSEESGEISKYLVLSWGGKCSSCSGHFVSFWLKFQLKVQLHVVRTTTQSHLKRWMGEGESMRVAFMMAVSPQPHCSSCGWGSAAKCSERSWCFSTFLTNNGSETFGWRANLS